MAKCSLLHHPDDETLTVEAALATLRSQSHQRIAALLEWLAERVVAADREANDLMAVAYRQGYEAARDDREAVEEQFEQAKKDGLL